MPYKISGYLEKTSKVIVFDETDYSIEHSATISGGNYEITGLNSSNKMVAARAMSDGQVIAYGNVSPFNFGYELPAGSYVHYDADSLTDTTAWPDENGNVNLTNKAGTINLVSAGLNGHNYIKLATNEARFYSNTIAAIETSFTFGIVIRWSQLAAYGWSSPNGNGSFYVGARDTNSGVNLRHNLGANQTSLDGFGGNVGGTSGTSSWSTETWYVVTGRYKPIAGWLEGDKSGEVRVNGVRKSSANNTLTSNTGTHVIMMGMNYESFREIDIAEFVFYKSVLEDDGMTQLENYLTDKYGL